MHIKNHGKDLTFSCIFGIHNVLQFNFNMKNLAILVLALVTLSSCNQTQSSYNASTSETNTTEKKQKKNRRGGGDYTSKMVESLADDPFVGIMTSKGKQDGLFPIKSTGVSTEPIVKSANAFLNGLTAEQKEKITFTIDSDQFRTWSNVDVGMFKRNGISLKEMTQDQRKLAFQLLSDALSAKGLQLSKDIMKTDQTLAEVNNDNEKFNELAYYFTILGTPSIKTPWGFQLNGHHLAINYFVLGDQVVMTPTFMGGEPIVTTSGKYKGNTIFQDEQNLGLQLMQSLSPDLQKKAIIGNKGNRPDIEASAFTDNKTIDFVGVSYSELNTSQQEALLHLASQYINNIREGHAKVKMEDIKKHLDNTYFGWRGATNEDAVFYYRIHSPVVLIEFDHQSPLGIRTGDRKPTRNHIHTMVRTPNGNDYGKDYLQQHLNDNHQGEDAHSH